MSSILAICPARGRPIAAKAVLDSFNLTTNDDAKLVFVLDDDDAHNYSEDVRALAIIGPRRELAPKFSEVVMANLDRFEGFMFVGDDLRFETFAWDHHFIEALRRSNGFGIVYGDDRHFRFMVPTHPVLGARLVQALGWPVPPGIKHFVDVPWNRLGRALDLLVWVPEVITPHLRWDALHIKPDLLWTEMHQRCARHDLQRWGEWFNAHGSETIARVRNAMQNYETNKTSDDGAALCGAASERN